MPRAQRVQRAETDKPTKITPTKRARPELGAEWQLTDTSGVKRASDALAGCVFYFLSFGGLAKAQAERLVAQHGGQVSFLCAQGSRADSQGSMAC